MLSPEKVINDFERIAKEFYGTLASFTQEQLNVVPFEGSWTAGKVGRHVCKAVVNMPKRLQAPAEPVDRAPDQLVSSINKIFLDFSIKLKSPEFIIPEDKEYDRQELLDFFQDIVEQTLAVARNSDLSERTSFELPTIGYLTRLELIYFGGVHTNRHTRQLKRILAHLTTTTV